MGQVYSFQQFKLDLARGALLARGHEVALRPKSFALLRYLVEHADHLASKEELMQAVWPNAIVTDDSLKRCLSEIRGALGDDAQRIVKTVPRRGVRFLAPLRVTDDEAVSSVGDALPVPEQPSIAIMPFQNLSGDVEQDYFADGIVEDLITALSRTRWLFVIARNSTFTYKGRAVEIKQVARDLGVRYVLEGSVRRSGERVRITGQLLEAETGTCLWADRYDGRLEDVFDLQDNIASSIVGCIEPKMRTAEVRRAIRQTASLQAYDHFLRALAAFDRLTRASLQATLVECQKAVALDPSYASAYGLAAWCYIWRDAQAWTVDPIGERAESIRQARLAVEFGADDPTALWMAGHVIAYSGAGNEEGARIVDRSLAINPNSAQAWNVNGWVHDYLGQGRAAVGCFERAMRLSPLDPLGHTFKCGLALAHFVDQDYDQACRWADLALADQPRFVSTLRVKAAACGLLGRSSEARATTRALLAAVPHHTLADVQDRSWCKAPHYLAYLEGLRKAGVPEK